MRYYISQSMLQFYGIIITQIILFEIYYFTYRVVQSSMQQEPWPKWQCCRFVQWFMYKQTG